MTAEGTTARAATTTQKRSDLPPMKVGTVYLVGAGPGDPGLLTVRGADLLARAEVVVYDRLVAPETLMRANPLAEIVYVGKDPSGDSAAQDEINRVLFEQAAQGRMVVRLKGGDPFVFGRGGEEALYLRERGIPFEVVPGVTSAIAVPAYAGIPVTHRGLASSFSVITGHEDPSKPESAISWAHLARATDTLVFLMGVKTLPDTVSKLVANGRPATTPAAVISWGTWPRQRMAKGTLENIADRVKQAGVTHPAIFITGPTAGLSGDLAWFTERPLFGKTILVTRATEQAGSLAGAIRDLGGQALSFPAISIEPADPGPLREVAARLASFDWAVFTSPNGVSAFWRVLTDLHRDARAFGATKIVAIGPGTAAALEERGIRADLVPPTYRTQAVAEVMVPLIKEAAATGTAGVRGATAEANTAAPHRPKVLLLRADIAAKELPAALLAAGATVEDVPAYRTAKATQVPPEVVEALRAGQMDMVTFTSSSTVEGLLGALGGPVLLDKVAVAAIGPVTAETCRAHGLTVDVEAPEHTVPGLLAAIQTYFTHQGGGHS